MRAEGRSVGRILRATKALQSHRGSKASNLSIALSKVLMEGGEEKWGNQQPHTSEASPGGPHTSEASPMDYPPGVWYHPYPGWTPIWDPYFLYQDAGAASPPKGESGCPNETETDRGEEALSVQPPNGFSRTMALLRFMRVLDSNVLPNAYCGIPTPS